MSVDPIFVQLAGEDLQLAGLLQRLRDSTIGYSANCKEKVIRILLVRAGKNNNGIASGIVRWKMSGYLPAQFKTRDIEDAIIKVAAYAAANDELWNLVYPKGAIDQT